MNKIFKIIVTLSLSLIFVNFSVNANEEKIKIGLLVPMTGDDKDLGQLLIKASMMALEDINDKKFEIYPKDTASNPDQTLKSAIELKQMGIKIIIGPVFYKSLNYLDDIEDIIFLSFTNKTLDLPKNVISSGVNSTSQLNSIKKFLDKNEINKTIFLTPKVDYQNEIKKGIKESKIKISKNYLYDTEPTKLTKQIE